MFLDYPGTARRGNPQLPDSEDADQTCGFTDTHESVARLNSDMAPYLESMANRYECRDFFFFLTVTTTRTCVLKCPFWGQPEHSPLMRLVAPRDPNRKPSAFRCPPSPRRYPYLFRLLVAGGYVKSGIAGPSEAPVCISSSIRDALSA